MSEPAADLTSWSLAVKKLARALHSLAPAALKAGVPLPQNDEWYELLRFKLLPQLEGEPWLVVAVVGGTNIGKSAIFNHLVGEVASEVSPLAAGTRHPVCLTPPHFADEAQLAQLFAGFRLQAWNSPANALELGDEDRLFWRVGRNVPRRLLVLDTPDIDSDAAVNWQRADHIRQSADVLLAVLTQQKYNDAAVKQFFRKAAESDKQVIVIFNQCDPVEDREFWPQWLQTFTSETGVRPALVYVAPLDRTAVRNLQLPFYDVGRDGRAPARQQGALREELAAMHFDSIKLRTLQGALRAVLDRETGAPAYLQSIRAQAEAYEAAARSLLSEGMLKPQMPPLPGQLLIGEIRAWWDDQRRPWVRTIHDAYRTLGNVVTWPIRRAYGAVKQPAEKLQDFRRQEWNAMVQAVEQLLDELERLSEVGNDILKPRLKELLAGRNREQLLLNVEQAYRQLPPIDEDYRQYLRAELEKLLEEHPKMGTALRYFDQAAAVARPAITVTFAISGWLLAGGLAHDVAVNLTGQTMVHLATEGAAAGASAAGGEAAVVGAGAGLQKAIGVLFLRLQKEYALQRTQWLGRCLEEQLLAGLHDQLLEGSRLQQLPAFVEAREALEDLQSRQGRLAIDEPAEAN